VSLKVDSYVPPAGMEITPSLYAKQGRAGSSSAPLGTWSVVSAASPLAVNPSQNTFITASSAGTWVVHFEDRGVEAGTDDDAVSPFITIRVLDIRGLGTPSVTLDDWAPAVTATPVAAVGAPLTATVDLTGLTRIDARGSSSGVGVLNSKLAALTGIAFVGSSNAGSAGPWLNNDLEAPFDYSVPAVVNTAGQRSVLANVTGHAPGQVFARGYFNADGVNGFETALANTATSQVVSALAGRIGIDATPAVVNGAGNVVVRGTVPVGGADPMVTVYGNGYALRTVEFNPVTGAFAATVNVNRTMDLTARTSGAISATVRITVRSVVQGFTATALGNRKVRLNADGGALGGGTLRFYRGSVLVKTMTADAAGKASVVLFGQPTRVRSYRVTYTAPGASTSSAAVRNVRVR
jgi:hypothetical protein